MRLLLFAGCLGLPLVGIAQTTPHYYAGLSASLLRDSPFNQYVSPNLYGAALTGGVQLSPRWALQTGVGINWRTDSYTYPRYAIGGGSPTSTSYSSNRYTVLTVPVLVRCTFTQPAARFHVDGLAGFTLLHYLTHQEFSTTYTTGQNPDYQEINFIANDLALTLGPAVRYTLTPQVELVAHGFTNVIINNRYYSFNERFLFSALLGVHYTFGQR